jgi:hypothetical protein
MSAITCKNMFRHPIDIDGVITFVYFEVIEIVDDNCPYLVLLMLGIDWAFNNSTVVDLKKICMTFERDVPKVNCTFRLRSRSMIHRTYQRRSPCI